jgi:hypothetical protein
MTVSTAISCRWWLPSRIERLVITELSKELTEIVQIRPFDWRDLPRLHAYRNQTLYLNKALLLTRGPLQVLGAMVASVVPRLGIYTAVCETPQLNNDALIGQVIHDANDVYAYISFLAPDSLLTEGALPPLLDNLVLQVAGRGILRVLAEVEEHSPAVDAFRRAGFAVYLRQRIWRLAEQPGEITSLKAWRAATDRDVFAVRLLYANLVPGLVQQVEPVSLDQPRGLVYYQDGELLAYVELKYGMRGIWARPYVHPDIEESTAELVTLLQGLPARHARPVFLCVNAYQSWMDSILENLGAESLPRQVLMVKHLTVQKKLELARTVPGLEGHSETFAFTKMGGEAGAEIKIGRRQPQTPHLEIQKLYETTPHH